MGEGEQKKLLIRETEKLKIQDKVLFLGYKKNVYKYLLNSDCFILSSLWEDPGFVILEAALSNTFIISSNCPNGPSEILSHGQSGFLFQNNNQSDLLNKFDEFKKLNKNELYKKKIISKKANKNVYSICSF